MLNETIQGVSIVANDSLTFLKTSFLNRLLDIVHAPFKNYGMLWMLVPLLVTAIMLEIYFGRYKDEELGWNTAVGNSLILLFVAIDLFRHTYEPLGISIKDALFIGNTKIIIAMIVFCFGILLLLVDFFHILPKKVAYALSSPLYINILGLMGIIIVYSENIPLDWTTLAACLLLMIILTGITYVLYLIMPAYKSPLQRIFTIEDSENYNEKSKKDK